MATQLFKDGEATFVEASAVQRHLEAGWSVEDKPKPKKKASPKPKDKD